MSRKETIIGFMTLCIVSFVILAGWTFFFPESSISFYECFFFTMLASFSRSFSSWRRRSLAALAAADSFLGSLPIASFLSLYFFYVSRFGLGIRLSNVASALAAANSCSRLRAAAILSFSFGERASAFLLASRAACPSLIRALSSAMRALFAALGRPACLIVPARSFTALDKARRDPCAALSLFLKRLVIFIPERLVWTTGLRPPLAATTLTSIPSSSADRIFSASTFASFSALRLVSTAFRLSLAVCTLVAALVIDAVRLSIRARISPVGLPAACAFFSATRSFCSRSSAAVFLASRAASAFVTLSCAISSRVQV